MPVGSLTMSGRPMINLVVTLEAEVAYFQAVYFQTLGVHTARQGTASKTGAEVRRYSTSHKAVLWIPGAGGIDGKGPLSPCCVSFLAQRELPDQEQKVIAKAGCVTATCSSHIMFRYLTKWGP